MWYSARMRLSLDVDDALHLRIRVAAAHANQPMAEWIREALAYTLDIEESDEPQGAPGGPSQDPAGEDLARDREALQS